MESQNQMSIQPRTCQIHVAMIGTLSLLHLKLDHSAHGEMEKLRQDDPVPIACGGHSHSWNCAAATESRIRRFT